MPRNAHHKTSLSVGARIRAARNESRMSQEALGLRLGVSFQQVQKYEKGVNSVKPGTLELIADVLDKPVEWFFGTEKRRDGEPVHDLGIEVMQTSFGVRMAKAWLSIPAVEDRRALLSIAERFAARVEG